MKIKIATKKIVIYLVIVMALITSFYYLYKKFNHQRPIAAKLVMSSRNLERFF